MYVLVCVLISRNFTYFDKKILPLITSTQSYFIWSYLHMFLLREMNEWDQKVFFSFDNHHILKLLNISEYTLKQRHALAIKLLHDFILVFIRKASIRNQAVKTQAERSTFSKMSLTLSKIKIKTEKRFCSFYVTLSLHDKKCVCKLNKVTRGQCKDI